MNRTILAAVLLCLFDASSARAQFGFGPVCPPTYGEFGFSFQRPGVRVGGFAGGYYSRSVFVAPYGGGGEFWGPAWGGGRWTPPLVIVPPPVVPAEQRDVADPDAGIARDDLPKPIDLPPRGARPDEFVVIRPRKEAVRPIAAGPAPGQIVPPVDRVAAVPRPPRAFAFDPFAERVPVNVDRPDPDPAREAARQLTLGRAAFAAGEYGKAGERFDRAAAADPKAGAPHFLKAQAAIAAGGYADAVAAIRAGLAIDPAWPEGTFDPKEPYGTNPAAHAQHLAELRKAVAANPGEATLEFLLGYQLWFVGEKIEARRWFDAAAKRLDAPGPIALFK